MGCKHWQVCPSVYLQLVLRLLAAMPFSHCSRDCSASLVRSLALQALPQPVCHILQLAGYAGCRNEQLAPPGAFSSLVHSLAVTSSDLWCCTGSGIMAVLDLSTLQLKHKVNLLHTGTPLPCCMSPTTAPCYTRLPNPSLSFHVNHISPTCPAWL